MIDSLRRAIGWIILLILFMAGVSINRGQWIVTILLVLLAGAFAIVRVRWQRVSRAEIILLVLQIVNKHSAGILASDVRIKLAEQGRRVGLISFYSITADLIKDGLMKTWQEPRYINGVLCELHYYRPSAKGKKLVRT